jgi:L-ascorbate metabolism protein UlaG (beta-lactamase superfamily)
MWRELSAMRVVPYTTLWAGYAPLGAQHRAFYSGDTGFHPALGEIGRRFGPFDVTLIEAGQYDKDWPDWHLGPSRRWRHTGWCAANG